MNVRLASLRRNLTAALLLAPCAYAQQSSDPANLTGEHVSPQALADTLPINHGAPALEQLLLKLRTRASMMMIVAHPDDEDGGLLTYESRGQGARVAMLTLTRGEGGQNLVSADFDEALGLIRTQELLAADRYMGVDQMFGTEVDFGFSKTKEESFQKWTHERVLYDAVRCVRLYRPLVLASVFVGGVTDGHGHHQVAGEMTQEVFTAAADPKVFPEMGLPAWAPLKVYARVPFFRVTPQGMFDYATGKYSPVRFHNYVTGKDITHEPPATVQIHEGEVSQRLGMEGLSYLQFARKGLALQKTQIGANVRLAPAGAYDVGYTLMASRLPAKAQSAAEQSLFDGVDISLPGMASLAPNAPPTLRTTLEAIDRRVADAQRVFDPKHLETTATALREALHLLDALLSTTEASPLDPAQKFNLLHELRIKRVQLNDALVLALGVTLEAMIKPQHDSHVLPLTTVDPTIYTNARIANTGSQPLTLLRLIPQGESGSTPSVTSRSLPAGGSVFDESTVRYRTPPRPTRPYFSRPDIEQPFYDIADPALRNAPVTPAPFVSSALIDDQGVSLELRAFVPDAQTLQHRSAPPETRAVLPITVLQPAVVVPPLSINLRRTSNVLPFTSDADLREASTEAASSSGIIPLSTPKFQLGVRFGIYQYEDSILGPAQLDFGKIPVQFVTPPSWKVSAPAYNKNIGPVVEHFILSPGALTSGESYRLTAKATYKGHEYTEGFRPVGYPGLTYTNYYTPATYRATAVDVTTAPNLRIGYLPGTGDAVPEFLPSLGVTPTTLTLADLTSEKLKQYDAVLLGVRAYAAHPELAGGGSKPLLDYAQNGGIVIVQYNNSVYGADSAPYPLAVPGDPGHNVVVEADPVTMLKPSSPLLNWPNKITSADFDLWVEERGHGFAASFDPHYEALLETHDPDQDPQRGGLLVAPVGRGAYIYCALALYRQLPEGVPGAYRLLANLLSYAKNPQRP